MPRAPPLQVSLEFCSCPPSYRHPKVPEGLQYYTLQAQLSGALLSLLVLCCILLPGPLAAAWAGPCDAPAAASQVLAFDSAACAPPALLTSPLPFALPARPPASLFSLQSCSWSSCTAFCQRI